MLPSACSARSGVRRAKNTPLAGVCASVHPIFVIVTTSTTALLTTLIRKRNADAHMREANDYVARRGSR